MVDGNTNYIVYDPLHPYLKRWFTRNEQAILIQAMELGLY